MHNLSAALVRLRRTKLTLRDVTLRALREATESGFIADDGGFKLAFIRPAEGRKSFRVHQCEFAEERLQVLRRFSRRSRHSLQSCVSIIDRELSSKLIFESSLQISLRLCDLRATPLNQDSSQMKIDLHLSAHHVTTVTDAGGLAPICSTCGLNLFAFISVNLQKKKSLCVSASSAR